MKDKIDSLPYQKESDGFGAGSCGDFFATNRVKKFYLELMVQWLREPKALRNITLAG